MRNLMICFMGVTLFSFFISCQKEVSVEYGSPATGSLQNTAGNCLPKTVAGSYVAGKTINDSNFIEVTVNVVTPGPYSISTNSLNGYVFKATGTFANTGSNTLRLQGSGTPVNAAVNNFTVVFDSSSCDVSVTVLPSGSSNVPATYTLKTSGSNCAPFTPSGNYIKDTTLDIRHTVKVDVTVTAVGTYSINTNTVNGYFFSASGTFGATGVQTVTLRGSGKPLVAGTDNFTVTAGASTCNFPITVTATAPPPVGPCTVTNQQGTYTAGSALTAANTITLTHNYAAAGSYTVSTVNVNGYGFGTSNINATSGVNPITLTAAGTPGTAGSNTFTVNFGDGQSCTFTITVVSGNPPPVNNDYFPTTANSWWTYDDGAGADTFKMANTGTPLTIGGNTYQRFVFSDANGPFDTAFYRKDVATGFYYESIDTAGFGPDLTFSQPRLDVLFLKNTLATGNTWNSDFNVAVDGIPIPAVLRFKYNCINANAAVTVNGKNFTNVYHVQLTFEYGILGTFTDAGVPPLNFYYAKGIGQINVDNGTDEQAIRFWQVN